MSPVVGFLAPPATLLAAAVLYGAARFWHARWHEWRLRRDAFERFDELRLEWADRR